MRSSLCDPNPLTEEQERRLSVIRQQFAGKSFLFRDLGNNNGNNVLTAEATEHLKIGHLEDCVVADSYNEDDDDLEKYKAKRQEALANAKNILRRELERIAFPDTSTPSQTQQDVIPAKTPYSRLKDPPRTIVDRKRMFEEEREVVVSSVKRKRSKPKRQKENVTRKCHQCKAKAMDALKCAYYLPNGHMCKKSFCFDCLQTDYDLPEEEYRHDWQYVYTLKIIYLFCWNLYHDLTFFYLYSLSLSLFHLGFSCPACLGICKCPVCTKEREREQRIREKAARRNLRAKSSRK